MASLSGGDTGAGYGVLGKSSGAIGVIGESVDGIGALGQSSSGAGVEGDSESGEGVLGRSKEGSGVSGFSVQGKGVLGTSKHGVGVFAKSELDNGVLGTTEAAGSAGVLGVNIASDGGNGVVGIAAGLGGIGVFGNAEKRGVGVVGNGATGVTALGDAGPGVEARSTQDCGVRGTADREGFAGVRGDNPSGVGVEAHGRFGVVGNGSKKGVIGRSGTPPDTGWEGWLLTINAGVVGQSVSTPPVPCPGVAGLAKGPDSIGVYGRAEGHQSVGVEGSGGDLWVGVKGRGHIGVWAEAGAKSDSKGVFASAGSANATGQSAVFAIAVEGANAVSAIVKRGTAVLGLASGIEGTGIVGFCPHPTNVGSIGFAANFHGAVNVTGPVHKSGGGFRIDHPLEPETKYLDHSFVESDEMKNLYDGVAELDASGGALVSLPSWFETLNEDFRYQLTALGASAPDLHIRKEVSDGSFEIAGGRPGQRISWQITGRRQDRWARAYPLRCEVNKVELEQGRYRHPELYGLPRERGIEFALYRESIEAAEKDQALLKAASRDRPDVTSQ